MRVSVPKGGSEEGAVCALRFATKRPFKRVTSIGLRSFHRISRGNDEIVPPTIGIGPLKSGPQPCFHRFNRSTLVDVAAVRANTLIGLELQVAAEGVRRFAEL